ncbi:hypothetical protein MSAN_01379100 [Mycena sanguinolenta]|uniref:F-box domain-containing protein n=1 Tax=Mycena sanguinolenta TaxID=230812 RepID=A0A8H7CY74_9AGAR|nr:hypothetical protein MSAN_01379100 [Mycena sanguinolenta]
MAACQRALGLPKIVRIICGEADEEWRLGPQTTLVRLATTSKIFTEPALDVIWHDQTSLVPLIKCMPETLWEVRGVRGEKAGVVIHLCRPIISTDLPRFLFYSARVRDLDLRHTFQYRLGIVHPDFLRALDMSMPAQSFPKLSHFAWYPKKKDVLSIMRHFLGPRIRTIDLRLDDTAMLSILPFVKASCPLVSDFNFGASPDRISLPLVATVSDAVCGWRHLASLTVPDLDNTAFMHVAELALLTDLSLTFVNDKSVNPSTLLSRPTFPALQFLTVCCKTADYCASFVRVISSRRLRSLMIRPMSVWTTSAWEDLHIAIHDCLDQVALRQIEVEEGNITERPADDALSAYVLSSDAVRPLLAFKQLTHITYQIRPCLDVDDEFLKAMAQAWPNLSELQFGTDTVQPAITQAPKATLACLIPFARHCPNLSALGVCMDATRVPEFTQVHGDRISSSLEYLYPGTSPIDALKEGVVAAFISNLFPELEDLFPIVGGTPLPEPLQSHSTSWSRVSRLIPVFSSVRTQEEEFWTEELTDTEDGENSEDAHD